VGDYCIDEIIHLLEAIAKCLYSTIYSATKPWRLRFGEKISQIHEINLYLADFLRDELFGIPHFFHLLDSISLRILGDVDVGVLQGAGGKL